MIKVSHIKSIYTKEAVETREIFNSDETVALTNPVRYVVQVRRSHKPQATFRTHSWWEYMPTNVINSLAHWHGPDNVRVIEEYATVTVKVAKRKKYKPTPDGNLQLI